MSLIGCPYPHLLMNDFKEIYRLIEWLLVGIGLCAFILLRRMMR